MFIDRDTGDTAVIAGLGHGLDNPLSVFLAVDGSLYVTNSAAFPSSDPERPGASLLKLDLDVPGDPL